MLVIPAFRRRRHKDCQFEQPELYSETLFQKTNKQNPKAKMKTKKLTTIRVFKNDFPLNITETKEKKV
jgi:hypothetical protein